MLTRNHKSGTYLNSMHILVVFFLYYISHLCPQPYAAGLGPTVLILGIRGLCWIIDWCGNSWVNEKLEDIQCSGVRVNRPGLGEATLGVCVSVPLCTASFETFIKCKWSSTGKELLKNVLALSLKEEKHYIPAAQGVSKSVEISTVQFFQSIAETTMSLAQTSCCSWICWVSLPATKRSVSMFRYYSHCGEFFPAVKFQISYFLLV